MRIRNAILAALNRIFRLRGMELRALEPIETDSRMAAALRRASAHTPGIGTVIDVGAAAGHWTRLALNYFPKARYLLIEPLDERRAELIALHAEHANIEFVSAVAGGECGESFLQVSKRHLDRSGVYDQSGATGRKVPMTTLDFEIGNRALPPPYFLKLDTHGFELPILRGATAMLERTELVMAEVYNFEIASGCLRFPEFCACMEKSGFLPCDVVDPLRRPGDLFLWQMDTLFARANAISFSRKSFK